MLQTEREVRVKRNHSQSHTTGCRNDHLRSTAAEIKKVWSFTSTHPYAFNAWRLVNYLKRETEVDGQGETISLL